MIRAIIFDCFGVLLNASGTARNEELLSYVGQLRKQYSTAVLSNTGKDGLQRYFSQEELQQLFDAAVTSGEVGMLKPDPDIFMHMADRLGVEPGECIVIDDTEGHCAGARQAGMQAIWYRNFEQMKAELEQLLHDPEA